ncbi:MAG: DNA alkylation repair protein [bacterium]|nr:DNA alkylation repair protein [bacterium]
MNKYHQEILKKIKKAQSEKRKAQSRKLKSAPMGYLGNNHFRYCLSNPQERRIVADWQKVNKNIANKDFIGLLDSLYRAKSFEEKTIAGILLEKYSCKKEINPQKIGEWLNFLEGWAEVDMTCQSSFEAKDLLVQWPEWQELITSLVKDKNINKRRASLVLLARAMRGSADPRLAKIAFINIEKLKGEKHVLITKAISWILRSLIKYHKREMADYLKKNKDSLPRIAVRETQIKLATGRKN